MSDVIRTVGRSERLLSEDEAIAYLALSARDAARALGICRRTLHTLTQEGDLPVVRVGRRLLYRPESLRAWLAAREQRGNGESAEKT